MSNKYPSSHNERRKDIAMIIMAAKRLGMDTEDKNEHSEYRALMFSVTRLWSLAALDFSARRRFLDALNSLLEARGMEKVGGQRPGQAHKPLAQDKAAIERKIGAQLKQLDASWPYAYTIARKQFPEVSTFEFLTVEQMGKVSGALARTIAWREKKSPSPQPSPLGGEGAEGGRG
ncbi:MAG: DUF1018 domain-containing protein [Gallionellaceae bacterium]|nr:DUF1018 domain-containing protein [Gallionellaceae bacterium]